MSHSKQGKWPAHLPQPSRDSYK